MLETGTNTYEYLMMRSGYGWLASAATSCVTATWQVVLVIGDDDNSWVPTGTMSDDGGDSGLNGKTTNTKLDFVGIAVLGIVCKSFHTPSCLNATQNIWQHKQWSMFHTHHRKVITSTLIKLAVWHTAFTITLLGLNRCPSIQCIPTFRLHAAKIISFF